MYIKIENHDDNTTRVIDYPGTVLQFVNIHFTSFGFYRALFIRRDCFQVYDKFANQHLYTITKAKKEDMKK